MMVSSLVRYTRHIPKRIGQLFLQDCCCELCLDPVTQAQSSCSFLCNGCYKELPVALSVCSHCSEPMPPASRAQPQRCLRCQQHPPEYDYSHCRFLFHPPINLWIRAAKDKRQEYWLYRLATLMLEQPPAMLNQVDALVYIPSHWWTHWKRGYNPSEVLARALSHSTGIPIQEGCLHKRFARDQRHLSARERRNNLATSLHSGNQNLAQKHLLIIDDVMTTGATASAAAMALKHQGARIVGIWALARTPPTRRLMHNAPSTIGRKSS